MAVDSTILSGQPINGSGSRRERFLLHDMGESRPTPAFYALGAGSKMNHEKGVPSSVPERISFASRRLNRRIRKGINPGGEQAGVVPVKEALEEHAVVASPPQEQLLGRDLTMMVSPAD
jgi:hypothetical protein